MNNITELIFMDSCCSEQCTRIINFDEVNDNDNKNNNNKNNLDFADAVYVMTVKKNKLTTRQVESIKNINILGCGEKTYWCETLGYKQCDFKDVNENIMHNVKKIINHSLLNKFKNIIIFEDDFMFVGDINDKLSKKNKTIKKLQLRSENEASVIYLGYIPLTIKYIDDKIITGRFGNGHALLINEKAQQKILKYKFDSVVKNKKEYFDYDNLSMGLDTSLYLDKNVKHFAIYPNDLFFQKNEPQSSIGTTTNLSLNAFFRIQQAFTGEMYYQYSPKFVNYYEKFIYFISQFYDETEPAIILLHYNLKYGIIYFSLIIFFFMFFYYKLYEKNYKSMIQNANPMLYLNYY
jgi:hypothetical protein